MTRPEVAELEALRRALADYDRRYDALIQPETVVDGDGLAEAAREVLARYDEQLAAYDHAVSQPPISMETWRAVMGLPPVGEPEPMTEAELVAYAERVREANDGVGFADAVVTPSPPEPCTCLGCLLARWGEHR